MKTKKMDKRCIAEVITKIITSTEGYTILNFNIDDLRGWTQRNCSENFLSKVKELVINSVPSNFVIHKFVTGDTLTIKVLKFFDCDKKIPNINMCSSEEFDALMLKIGPQSFESDNAIVIDINGYACEISHKSSDIMGLKFDYVSVNKVSNKLLNLPMSSRTQLVAKYLIALGTVMLDNGNILIDSIKNHYEPMLVKNLMDNGLDKEIAYCVVYNSNKLLDSVAMIHPITDTKTQDQK